MPDHVFFTVHRVRALEKDQTLEPVRRIARRRLRASLARRSGAILAEQICQRC
ncbi:protein of unknown function (plasmid) [Paraburkholderia dioscoreae]|uniref:Uncharacterized protein n=1 Tax=Paraburkholderia dioscoreae TaxID=2604047 RepID=A0A5Q4YWP7_9BURK|nr:protein of unknown function [Paraburkholderia dioscoreae]